MDTTKLSPKQIFMLLEGTAAQVEVTTETPGWENPVTYVGRVEKCFFGVKSYVTLFALENHPYTTTATFPMDEVTKLTICL